VGATFVAVLAAEGHAHADDPSQAATPAPDPNAGGATPPPDTTPALPLNPGGSVDPTPTSPPPSTPPTFPSMPDGSIDVPTTPTLPATPPPTGDESATPGPDGGWPATTGNQTNQDAEVTTGGGAVANTGGNTGVATGPGIPGIYLPGGVSSTITTGTATGQGSVDRNGISQEINATVTQNGKVVVVQVAVIVNIGIGLAGSGGNVADTESMSPPKPISSVAMIVGSEAAGAGTGPTPVSIGTGNASSTGNSGSTKVTQSIVLTGNDVAQQLAAVLNLGVGVANSGLNFALAAVSGNNSGSPSSVTFVTAGAPSSITAGSASALGNRSTSAVFQVVTVSASGNGSLLVIQRAVIVNFGLALANTGLNVAGGGALNAAMPDPAAAQQLLLMLLGSGGAAPGAALTGTGGGGGPIAIGTGNAHAVGNDTTTGIHQTVTGSVTDDETAKAIQDAWVGNFGIALANTGANGAGTGLAGIDGASLQAARGALQAFLAGLTGIGDPLQGLDASFKLGGNLLQLHGDVSGTESLLGITEPGTDLDADDASVVVRQVTAVLNIGLALGESGHNVAVATTEGTDHSATGGTGATVATTTITTGDATAVGSHFATTICQTIGDALACAPKPVDPGGPGGPDDPGSHEPPAVVPTGGTNLPQSDPAPFTPMRVSVPGTVPATLPFTGSPIGAELAAGSGVLIAGMLMARRRRIGANR
jgi:hypothetical protein